MLAAEVQATGNFKVILWESPVTCHNGAAEFLREVLAFLYGKYENGGYKNPGRRVNLLVDFSKTPRVDVHGVIGIILANAHVRRFGGSMKIADPKNRIQLEHRANLFLRAKDVKICRTVDEAVQSFARR